MKQLYNSYRCEKCDEYRERLNVNNYKLSNEENIIKSRNAELYIYFNCDNKVKNNNETE